jgi:hypothetical protein
LLAALAETERYTWCCRTPDIAGEGLRYFRFRWNDDPGGEQADWGCSTWYFEVGDDNIVVRQWEVYDGGVVLLYDEQHVEDQYGKLSDQPFDVLEAAARESKR